MPRRRAFKLSLTAFVVITVVWLASGWVHVRYSSRTTTVGISGGAVVGLDTTRYPVPLPAGFGCSVTGWGVWLLPERTPGAWLVIPLWPPALLAGIAAIVFGYRSRPNPPGHCKACRYDLTGNVSGVCPECGTRTGDG